MGNAVQLVQADNSYLSRAHTAAWEVGSGFTAAGWIKRDTVDDVQYIVGKYATGKREWALLLLVTNALSARLSADGTNATTFTTTLSIDDAEDWHFVALRYDASASGAELIVNLDAQTKQTAAHAGGVNDDNAAILLGAITLSLSDSFDGRMDAWGFWSRALTDEEIATLRNSGSGLDAETLTSGLKTGLIAWYDLEGEDYVLPGFLEYGQH